MNVEVASVLLVNGQRLDVGIWTALLHRLGDRERGMALLHLRRSWKLDGEGQVLLVFGLGVLNLGSGFYPLDLLICPSVV